MNDPIIAKVILQMFVLLITAKILGNLFRKINYPPVVGEFLAGLIWGPSLMKWLMPSIYDFLFPPSMGNTDKTVLGIVTIMGLLTMLSLSGIEIKKFPEKLHKVITWHTFITLCTSFTFGFLLLLILPDVLINENVDLFDLGFFLSICLMMSAIPIISRILNDWGIVSSRNGQFLLLSAVTIDLVGWILLSIGIILATSQSNQLTPLFIIEQITIMLVGILALLIIGRMFMRFLERKKLDYLFWPTFLGFCVYTHFVMEVNIYIGALLFGIVISSIPRSKEKLAKGLEGFPNEVFTPLFFAVMGHHGDMSIFRNVDIIIFFIILLFISVIVKLIPSLVLRFFNYNWNEFWLITFCLNARGGMEIIIATAGISIGVFNNEMYTILITAAILTAISCPLIMNRYMKNQ